MAKQWVLKLDRQDDDQGHLLIRVTSRDSDDLDLDLLATEGEEVFKGKLRRNDLKAFRAKTYNGTEDEWEAILRYSLLERESSAISKEQKQSLEVGASRQDQEGKPVFSITFRNRIDDITQRIGAIELSHTSKTIQLFDWASLAVDKNIALESELSALSERTDGDKATIARLETQLADLIRAKADHEEQMLMKFVLLLNEKKAKIRDQQRLIQTARFDEDKGKQLRALKDVGHLRSTTRRKGKRSAPDEDDSGGDESQAFETQTDRRGESTVEDQEMDSDRHTGLGSTESEADDDVDELSIRAKETSPRKASPKSTKKSATTTASIPPARVLSFEAKRAYITRSGKQSKVSEPAPIDDDEETASEDDEL